MNEPIFQVGHLSLAYPGHRGHPAAPILDGVSFTVERGRALTLVGPSGSGKSSLLRCLNRLVESTSGTVRFDGRDARSFDPRELSNGKSRWSCRRRCCYIIPIAGMILGNSMTSAALAGDRLQGDLRARADEIEARLALGFSGREAVEPMVRASLRAAMIPTVNGMMTVGLVQLPGMMTGQILAGSSPLVAIRYQMLVVFMLAAPTALGSLLFVRLAAARYFTAAHQLRRYLL